ncbi:RNA-directed DNA polymerase from mobile element jockey-like [Brachionus plicatilis]|uniref:RNA-directed DNA polymerase from mobile element jockey-like n=1 Tax=Brachionus plicatilis TaxID=10195 RepID=A0A3M7PL49_BRAPC|nr:RNA-directed DNA polymerase from mobile element jockey-like [Brachionus plicatilis]
MKRIRKHDESVNVEIDELPNGKSSVFGDTCNEMFKYGCIDELSIILAKIFETMIKYNQLPYLFNVGKILPILKNNNGPNNEINNTRPITISDTISNLFEKYILHRLERKHSDPQTHYYEESLALVQNKDQISSIFKTSIGVKQGGPLSPKLFSIYVEDLINEIMSTELITDIDGIKTGILVYADDLLIMTDSVKKMEKVLKICETFGIKTEIKFNPTKTQIMRINGTKQDETSLELCGEEIEWVRKLKYLGVWVDGKHYSKEHLRDRRLSTWRAFYLLKTSLDICSKNISPQLKANLFKTYDKNSNNGRLNDQTNAVPRKKIKNDEPTLCTEYRTCSVKNKKTKTRIC